MLIEKGQAVSRPGPEVKFRAATAVLLTGNLEQIIPWYRNLGFEAVYFPPGFCIFRRDDIQIFFQHQDGYVRPDDPLRRERCAWDLYIETDDVATLFADLSKCPDVNIIRGLCKQEYGQTEFELVDPNGYVLVFAQPSINDA